jgi:hypothetical protein
MLRRVVSLKYTDVSEVRTASIIRAMKVFATDLYPESHCISLGLILMLFISLHWLFQLVSRHLTVSD